MARRGRPPKPTRLKLVMGNPGKRKLPVETEWEPGGEAVPPKSVLRDSDALEIWDQYAPMLTEVGLLTSADAGAFCLLCLLFAEFESRPSAFNASRLAQLRGLMSSFGLDPSSRARLPMKPKDEEADPEEKFFDG